ncbi:hypothetical protein D0865_06920 [Hortaea werneckii]|uniref:Uncharacterized protein n=1 Tax=Hortaea werneckii TaxID=91943 RepID=A0A3M7CEL1_HORWE|nr:hypothetical protein D0865_06920 [Hortaea werneckii]
MASLQARNNRDSPFLRLPPEIRNRIYDLSLGGGVIHISTRPCDKAHGGSYSKDELYGTANSSPSPPFVKFVHVICDGSVDAERNIWGNSQKASQAEVPSCYAYYARHSQCTDLLKCAQEKRVTHSLPMSLIRIYGHMALGPGQAPKMLRGLQTLEVVSPVLLKEDVGPRALSQIGNHYGPFQVSSRGLETVWVNYPKNIGEHCREQLWELANRWLHGN